MKKRKSHKLRTILLLLLAVLIAAGAVYIHFGGFGTGESADPDEFAKYAADVKDIEIPKEASVIALGEATHGNKEFQRLKLDVFKLMVEKYGVRAFALEGDFGGCESANRYIHGGGGTAEQAVSDIGFDLYKTEEMSELIKYMRRFNQTAAEGDDIRFYGFDMQNGGKSFAFLMEECDRLGIDTEEIGKLVIDGDWSPGYDYPQRKTTFEDLRNELTSDFAVHLADVLIQNCELMSEIDAGVNSADTNALRDSYMKENTMWIMKQEQARGKSKLFIAGHNGHVEKLSGSDKMGSLLSKELGYKYYVIGTGYYKTTCNLPSMSGKRGNHTFYSHDPLAKAAKLAGYDECWLDFGRIPNDSSLKDYTGEYIYNGSLGEGYNLLIRVLPMGSRVYDNPEKSYDSMIYVTNATPTEINTKTIESLDPDVIHSEETTFSFTIDDFIEQYNRLYEADHGEKYLSLSDSELQYVFPEDDSALSAPRLCVTSDDNGYVKSIGLKFDWHSYSDTLLDEYTLMCFYSMKVFLPDLSDEELTELCNAVIDTGYDNPVDRESEDPYAVFYTGDIGIQTRFAIGSSQVISIIPLTDDMSRNDKIKYIPIEERLK